MHEEQPHEGGERRQHDEAHEEHDREDDVPHLHGLARRLRLDVRGGLRP